ncbi:hypothetical protein FQN53_004001 [Emmonsiellopsis sp. PD_33]|nr:hypothetical protein FQN53_004001 [Emmonsiellopsis sp. PD_33]
MPSTRNAKSTAPLDPGLTTVKARRAKIRGRYRKTGTKLLDFLGNYEGNPYLGESDLEPFKVKLFKWDPKDETDLNSNDSFFLPLSRDKLQQHPVEEYSEEDEDSESPRLAEFGPGDERNPYNRAHCIDCFLDSQLFHVIRVPSMLGLYELENWKAFGNDHPFNPRSGLINGPYSPTGMPDWKTNGLYEYIADPASGKVDPHFPHLMLITLHGANGKNDRLLVGELANAVQAIFNRMEQDEFRDTTLFPVLVISLFGPQHGRLIVAHFECSGILHVHYTDCFSFMTNAEAKDQLDLFLRYMVSKPLGGPEREFFRTPKPTFTSTEVAPSKRKRSSSIDSTEGPFRLTGGPKHRN